MKYNIYVLCDEATGLSQLPTFARSDAEILRSLAALPADNYIRMFPKDFRMYHIGVFDNETVPDFSVEIFKEPSSFSLENVFQTPESEAKEVSK